ncbi:hypothetical protein [Pseudodesulfovibrio sediminis]|uniref:Uncharacterized protein n=1 Tax=Pseudodesulfovibrio sediminis TaxID=2810563 RepID=A0ABM8I3W4_9BACT|nr:hypothetical protein [Pseudodesulfovibrio sediminis]BCS89375.1 hypothetical protein PSDVSF_26170 [Pseudodesulfovibrio sediminis]
MSNIFKFLLSFALFVIICWFGLQWFVNSEVKKELDTAVSHTTGLTLTYADLSVDILEKQVVLKDVATTLPSGVPLTADEVRIIAFDQLHEVPHFATLKARGLTIPNTPKLFGDYAQPMTALGIADFAGDTQLDYTYHPDDNVLEIKSFSFNDPKLGFMKLRGSLNNIDLDEMRAEQSVGVGIKDVRLTFTDNELMNILTADWARKMGMSRETTLDRISTELDGLARYAGKQDNQNARDVMLGLKRFLNDPGTLSVSATPKKPVPVLYFFMGRDIFDNLQLLNLKIETDSSEGI